MRARGWMLGTLPLLVLAALNGVATAGIDETYKRPGPSIWQTDYYARLVGRSAFRKSIAVVIGVGEYDRFPKLSAPANDALKMRDFLRDDAGFDEIITLTEEKATQRRISQLMERVIPNALGPNDRFLFYFSGHGHTRTFPGRSKRGYLVLKPADQGDWEEMIEMPRLKQWAENVGHARHSLFLLDACFSGLAAAQAKGDVGEKTRERLMQSAHHIVTAGIENELSYIVDDQSLFTDAFLAAARGVGMAAGDGIVSLNEMMSRINRVLDAKRADIGDAIKMTPRQYYVRTDDNGGEFFFLPQGLSRPSVTISPAPSDVQVIPKSGFDVAVAPSQPTPPVSRPPPSSAIPRFTLHSRTEASGAELGTSSIVASADECEQKCTQLSGCNAFTFSRGSRICFLYSRASLSGNDHYDAGVREGTVAPLVNTPPIREPANVQFTLRRGVEATGTEVEPASAVASIDDCERKCAQASSCNAFTFSQGARICYTYSKGDLRPNEFFDTGVRPSAITRQGQTTSAPSDPQYTTTAGTEALGTESAPTQFAGSAAQCQQVCTRRADCRIYSYSHGTNACYTYTSATFVANPYFEVGIRQ